MASFSPLKKDILKAIGNRFNKDLLTFQREQKSKANLSNLLPFYFPWSHYTIRYYDLELIVNQIFFSETKEVLELGSGLSTLCLGILGKKLPGLKVRTLEHDEGWCRLMRQLIQMNEIENIQLDFVPLENFSIDSFSGKFYDMDQVDLENYDAVIIDGPPANKKDLTFSRYPAIQILKKSLNKGGFFYLDDIHREGERKCLENWQNFIAIKQGMRHTYGNGQIFHLIG